MGQAKLVEPGVEVPFPALAVTRNQARLSAQLTLVVEGAGGGPQGHR